MNRRPAMEGLPATPGRWSRAGLALGLVLVLALGGCAQTPKSLYQWDSYQDQLYEHFKGDRQSPAEQVRVLEAQAQKARGYNRALPPGFRAHLGMMYLRLGRDDEARRLFEAEKASFPESTQYMDFLLKRLTAARSPANVASPL